MTPNEEMEQRLRNVVAWLRAIGNDAGDAELKPSTEEMLEAASALETAVPGLLQRDDTFDIPAEISVTLKRPFKRAGKQDEPELTVLSFHPPTAGELKQISQRSKKSEEEAGLYMLYLLSNDKLLMVDIEQRMLALDAQLCGEALQPFLALAPYSGKRRG